ncbi:534_t:CDS:2, partial [Racocetra fulgida]
LITIATVDEGYAIVYTKSYDTTNSNDPRIIRAALYIQTIGYGDEQICTLTMIQTNVTNNTTDERQSISNSNTYNAKISFLSSGSVIEFTPISVPNVANITEWSMYSLPYGGYLLLAPTLTPNSVNTYAYAFDEYSDTWQPWDLPDPIPSNLVDTVSGLLRLTLDGTAHYESLNSSSKNEFFSDLQDEISKILPVSPSRLSSNKHVQVDLSINSGRHIFLLLNIKQTKDKNERSVASLIRDLNTMIRNKEITSIGLGNTVKYLDETYGFVPSPFTIIIKENTRPEFFSWFVRNGNVTSIFTILAGTDIEALVILKSNLAGFASFQAPFSDKAQSKIFWGTCLNIFTEDIPQAIIQVKINLHKMFHDFEA